MCSESEKYHYLRELNEHDFSVQFTNRINYKKTTSIILIRWSLDFEAFLPLFTIQYLPNDIKIGSIDSKGVLKWVLKSGC